MSFVKSLFGGSSAGSNAAEAMNPYFQQAINELRRQFNATQKNIMPFISAGTNAISQAVDSATPQGLDAMLRKIFSTDIFGGLVDERSRSMQGQLAAGGLTRSGTALQEMAKIPQDIGLAIESLLSGRNFDIYGSGLNAASGLGSLGGQSSSAIANLMTGIGENIGSGIITNAQSRAAGGSNFLNLAGSIIGGFFSDPRLKGNVESIGNIHDLTLYQWDWIPGAKDTLIEKCMTIGFMADEVKEKYPEFVDNFCGFDVIAYPELLDHLETIH